MWDSSCTWVHFKYFLDDLFPLVIAGFVPVLLEIDCLSPWFIVFLLPCACCQFVVHRIHCYRVLYFPVLPPARINHGIWANHLTESFNARRSAIDTFLFRNVPCNDLLSFISDYKRPNGKYRTLSCQNLWHEGFCWPIQDWHATLSDLIIGRTLLVCYEVLHAQAKTKITRRRLSCAVIFIISQQKRKMYRSNIFLRDYYKSLVAIFYKNSKRFRIPSRS